MKTALVLACVALLTGCATSSDSSSAAADNLHAQQRERAVAARAKEFERYGMSSRDARARAEREIDGLLVSERRAEPSSRSTPQ